MQRRPVRSSNVVSIGWEPSAEDEAQGTLEIEFKRGGIYQYAGVPESTYQELLGADSIGRYVNQNVVGQYEETKVR